MSDGAVPEQEMCEHCSSYDGGHPCHKCGALSPADQRNPSALRRAADIIEANERERAALEFEAKSPEEKRAALLDFQRAMREMRDAYNASIQEAFVARDPFLTALEKR